MGRNTGPQGLRDFTLIVGAGDNGTVVSEIQNADFIINFSMKGNASLKFTWQFEDEDGYILNGGKTQAQSPGPQAGPVNVKCRHFRFRLIGADIGTYNIRVYVDK